MLTTCTLQGTSARKKIDKHRGLLRDANFWPHARPAARPVPLRCAAQAVRSVVGRDARTATDRALPCRALPCCALALQIIDDVLNQGWALVDKGRVQLQ